MSIEVSDVGAATRTARDAIVGLGGYVGASTTSNDGDQPSAAITYRIPAAKWEAALDLLRGLNGLTTKVVTEHTEAVEVTSQVIDLQARITNLRASETALQGIAAKATKISDVLEVQAQLTQTRGEIETLTAQLKDLNDRAGYATLTVQFNVPILAVEVAQKGWDPSSVIDEAAASMVVGPPGPGDRRDLVRHRVAADPADRGPRRRHRGRDRAATRATAGGRPVRCRPRRSRARADAPPGLGFGCHAPQRPWHHARVTDQVERFDRFAAGYARWWAPVLAPAVTELLDTVQPAGGGAERLLDIGTGTAQLGARGRHAVARCVGRRG